jgi:hypothetical protein
LSKTLRQLIAHRARPAEQSLADVFASPLNGRDSTTIPDYFSKALQASSRVHFGGPLSDVSVPTGVMRYSELERIERLDVGRVDVAFHQEVVRDIGVALHSHDIIGRRDRIGREVSARTAAFESLDVIRRNSKVPSQGWAHDVDACTKNLPARATFPDRLGDALWRKGRGAAHHGPHRAD